MFAQLEPSFPPFGPLSQLKPTLAKLFCYRYVTTRPYSDNWTVSCKLARLGSIIWPTADASFDLICNLARVWLELGGWVPFGQGFRRQLTEIDRSFNARALEYYWKDHENHTATVLEIGGSPKVRDLVAKDGFPVALATSWSHVTTLQQLTLPVLVQARANVCQLHRILCTFVDVADPVLKELVTNLASGRFTCFTGRSRALSTKLSCIPSGMYSGWSSWRRGHPLSGPRRWEQDKNSTHTHDQSVIRVPLPQAQLWMLFYYSEANAVQAMRTCKRGEGYAQASRD